MHNKKITFDFSFLHNPIYMSIILFISLFIGYWTSSDYISHINQLPVNRNETMPIKSTHVSFDNQLGKLTIRIEAISKETVFNALNNIELIIESPEVVLIEKKFFHHFRKESDSTYISEFVPLLVGDVKVSVRLFKHYILFGKQFQIKGYGLYDGFSHIRYNQGASGFNITLSRVCLLYGRLHLFFPLDMIQTRDNHSPIPIINQRNVKFEDFQRDNHLTYVDTNLYTSVNLGSNLETFFKRLNSMYLATNNNDLTPWFLTEQPIKNTDTEVLNDMCFSSLRFGYSENNLEGLRSHLKFEKGHSKVALFEPFGLKNGEWDEVKEMFKGMTEGREQAKTALDQNIFREMSETSFFVGDIAYTAPLIVLMNEGKVFLFGKEVHEWINVVVKESNLKVFVYKRDTEEALDKEFLKECIEFFNKEGGNRYFVATQAKKEIMTIL